MLTFYPGILPIIINCDQTDKGELYAVQSFGLIFYLIKALISYLRKGIRWKFRFFSYCQGFDDYLNSCHLSKPLSIINRQNLSYFIGIDISKKFFDAATIESERTTSNVFIESKIDDSLKLRKIRKVHKIILLYR